MTPGLDLSPSEAKLARAREHFQTLQRDVTIGIEAEAPYGVRFSEVDPQTGWCSISMVPVNTEQPRLSVVFGDAIHNLRCALDYVVTALADASQTELTRFHQFPICRLPSEYRRNVGSAALANPAGPLQGITRGLALIEQWQPYNTDPDPREAFLWGIHRFSNTDKHREPATYLPEPIDAIQVDPNYRGRLVETKGVAEITDWRPDKEYVIGHMRFDPPVAENLRATGQVRFEVKFVTPPFGDEPELAITLLSLRRTIQVVARLLDAFRQL